MTKIRSLRIEKGLSLRDIANPLGRTSQWLNLVELDRLAVDEKIESAIIDVINRLAEFRANVRIAERHMLSNVVPLKQIRVQSK